MKTFIFTSLFILAASLSEAQFQKSEQIIIRSDGNDVQTMKVEINGDQVTVNGKPLSEFKDSNNIIINKRKRIITADDDNVMKFDLNGDEDNLFSEEKSRPFLGVTSAKPENEDQKGARVTSVSKGSAAEKAGLEKGDIITKINDRKITDPASLSETVRSFQPNEEVSVYVQRNGNEIELKTTLGEKKEKTIRKFTFIKPGGGNFTEDDDLLKNMDVDIKNIRDPFNTNSKKQKLGLKIQDTDDGKGVKIIQIENKSAAANAGLLNGDLINEIDGTKITNTDDARQQLIPEDGKKSYQLKILRNKKEMNIEVRVPKTLKTANL